MRLWMRLIDIYNLKQFLAFCIRFLKNSMFLFEKIFFSSNFASFLIQVQNMKANAIFTDKNSYKHLKWVQ
jgi:hypothetical protein